MAERRHFSGDREAAFDYLGLGRSLLDQLLLSMRMNNLQVLSHSTQLQNGVTITVSSVFGHNNISIDAPASIDDGTCADMHQLVDEVRHLVGFVNLADFIRLKSEVALTVTTRTPPPPPPPDPTPPPPPVITPVPPPSGGGGGGGSDPDPGTDKVDINVQDYALVQSDVQVVISVRKTIPGGLKPTGPSIIIGGGTQGGDGFVWDDYNGYTQLDDGGNYALQRRNATVVGLSPDGKVLCGYVQQYDGNPNKALTNPYTGKTPPIGWITRAAKWASRTDQPQLPVYTSGGTNPDIALTVTNDGNTVKGMLNTGGGFSWNGRANTNWSNASTPAQMGLTSPDGKVVVHLDGTYTIGGQKKQWRGSVGLSRDAPSDAVPGCVVHVTPPMKQQPAQDVITTYRFVFSG